MAKQTNKPVFIYSKNGSNDFDKSFVKSRYLGVKEFVIIIKVFWVLQSNFYDTN